MAPFRLWGLRRRFQDPQAQVPDALIKLLGLVLGNKGYGALSV